MSQYQDLQVMREAAGFPVAGPQVTDDSAQPQEEDENPIVSVEAAKQAAAAFNAMELEKEDAEARAALDESNDDLDRAMEMADGVMRNPMSMREMQLAQQREDASYMGQAMRSLRKHMPAELALDTAKFRELNTKSGLPRSVIAEDPKGAQLFLDEKQEQEYWKGFTDTIQLSPDTVQFLRESDDIIDQMAISMDKLALAYEKGIREANGDGDYFGRSVIDTISSSWDAGMLQRQVNELWLKDFNGQELTDEEKKNLADWQRALEYLQDRSSEAPLWRRAISGTVGSLGVPMAGMGVGAVKGMRDYGPTAMAAGAGVGAALGSMAGGVGAAPGAALGAGKGLLASAITGGVEDMMTQEMLGLYATLKGISDEEGRVIDDDVARSISMAYGAAAGLLEFTGEGAVAALLVPQLRKYLAGNVSSRALNALLKSPAAKTAWGKAVTTSLKTVGAETATEVSQTIAENTGEAAALAMSDVNKAQKSGKEWMGDIVDTIQQTGEAMIIPSVFGGAVHARHYSKSRQDQIVEMGQRRLKISDKTAEFMQASEVAKKDPKVVEKLMQTMQDNGTLPEQVYIKPEALQEVFFQDGDEELIQAAEKMGITPEKINEAMALGTDVAIDYSKAASGIMADKMRYAKLRNEMRLDPSDPNAMELEEIQKLNATEEGRLRELKSVVKNIQEDEQKAQARYEGRLAIAKPYIDQLVQQGYTQDQANAYGTVLAAAAQRMAPAFGMEPAEYLQAKFGGYERMTQKEFERMASGGLYQFLGERGAANLDKAEKATRRLDNLGVARQMEKAGKKASAIKLATGWERGADGKWRYEIDDSGVTFHPKGDARFSNDHPEYRRYRELERKALLETMTDAEQAELKALSDTWGSEGRRLSERVRNGNATLENIIDAPELFEAYPKLRTMPVVITKFADDVSDYGGFFRSDINGGRIILNEKYRDDKKKMQSVLLHEIQHAIQHEEGFAPGGSPSDFRGDIRLGEKTVGFAESIKEKQRIFDAASDELKNKIRAINQARLDENFDEVDRLEAALNRKEKKIYKAYSNADFRAQSYQDQEIDTPQEAYRRLAGEAEARNTSRRMNMTAQERLQSLASETEDVAREDQITLRQGLEGGAAMSASEDQAYASGLAAMNKVIAEHADVLDAMYRPEVGGISFYWGKEGKGAKGKGGSGVAHIISRRNAEGQDGEAVARKMVEVLAYGNMGEEYGPEGGQHRNVSFDGHTAVLSLYRFGDRQTWLLTGWEDNPAGETETVNASSPTQASPSGIRDRLGATESSVNNSIRPFGSDGKPLFQSLYSGGRIRARGALRQMADGRYIVGLFRKRNLSTVLHETSHFWLQELRDAAKLQNAPEWIKDCWAKLQQTYKFEGFLDDPAQFEQWREVQENWARQFEAYCREGKAPSEDLQSAFNRFRSWLMDIYKTVRRLLGKGGVNEDVREVFDRLLATQEEIDASQRSATSASVIEEFVDEVAPELRDKYAKAVRVAHDRASLAIANRRLVEQRAAEKEARAAAMGELLNSPEYQAIAKFREWGLPYEGLLASVNEETANNLRAKWGKWAKEKALIRPMKMSAEKAHAALQDVAEQLNMATVDDLVGWLLHTPTEQEFIAQSVERTMQEWNAAYDGEVDYSDAMDEALGIELEALTGQTQIGTQALRREMDIRTGVKKMADVDAEYKALKAALRREAQAARKIVAEVKRSTTAEVKGKLSEAAKEKLRKVKEQERLRRAALAADYRARIEREHILRQLKRIAASKSVPYEYMLQIRRTLQNWGLLTSSQKIEPTVLRGMPSFSEFLAGASLMEGDETTVPSWIENQDRGRPGDLSLERLREMKDFLASVAHQGRTQDQMLGAMEKGRIADVAQKCKEQADTMQAIDDMPEESRRSLMEQMRSFFRGMLSEMGFVRFMARRLDNYKNTGLFHRVLLFPLQQAQSRELSLRKEYTDKLREVLKPLFDNGLQAKQFTIDGVRLSDDVSARWKGLWDMDKVYSVALNMGNAGNLKALMRGYGWSEEDLLKITSRLSSEEWQAIQKIWDTIDELYPALNEVAVTLKGAPLPKVKGQPFSVVAADGKIVKLKGGYYPLIFDQTFSDKAAIQQNNDELINGMEAIMRKPNPKDGMTKTRTGGTLPPRLTMQVLDRHITDTCHYISYAIPLRDTQRLISEPAFKQGFVRAMGRENYQELLPWLRGIARPGNPNAGSVERKLDWLAQRASIWALGMNLKSSLLQLTSVGNSWSEVGIVPFTKAAFRMILNPLKTVQEVRHHSAYMQARMQLLDDTLRREYDDIKKKDVFGLRLNGRLFSLDSLRQAQMALIGILDSAVAMPTWIAAYERAVERGVTEDEAVAEADSTIVAAQGGGGNMDTASLMRNKAWMRVLCPFMSFAMADNARKREAIGGLREWLSSHGQTGISPVQFSRRFAYESVLPVVLTVWLIGLGREGEPPEPEDYLWEALGFHTMGVPFARDIARGLESSFTGKGIGGRTPLALGWMDNMAKAFKDVAKIAMDEGDDKSRYRALKEIVNVAGFFAGVGTPQIWRTIEGSQAYFVDGEGGPLAPALGKPQKKNQ